MHKINSLDHYGRGIIKNEKIIFVDNALPNEIVDIKIKKENKKYLEANVSKYIKKSNDRVSVKCPYYNECGGCNIMHLSYDNQLKFKQEKTNNIISKYFKNNIKINKIVKSDIVLNYRNKVEFQVKEKIGFYKKNSYDLVNIDKCIISNDLINDSIKYLEKLDLNKINRITCRTGLNDLMIIIETNDKKLNIDALKNIAQSIYLKVNNEYIHVFGNKNIYEKLENYEYIISPESFFQINVDVCTKLYKKIKQYIGKNKKVLDLYCGTGSIGIFISNDNEVIGIEKNKFAIMDANKNKELNKTSNTKFICGDSGKTLIDLNFKPDIIIVDPPRSGLNKETVNNILKFKVEEIIYVSCDQMTLMRDLNMLNEFYDIVELTPFDMFPNTYHIESLTYLKRKM